MENNIFFLNEINELSKTDSKLLVNMAEEMYHNQIKEVVGNILKKDEVSFIMLAGPSSSGKTTTSKLISKELEKNGKKSVYISLDDFFFNRDQTPRLENGKPDFEGIGSIDTKYFNECMHSFETSKKAYLPTYNFIKGRREDQLTETVVDDNTYFIIEGLHALNPTLSDLPTNKMYKIYICPTTSFFADDTEIISFKNLRFMRRCIRDFYTRAKTIEETAESWKEVTDAEKIYITPYIKDANFIVDSTHMYEPLLYATYLKPILEKSKNNNTAKCLVNMLATCETLDKNVIPNDSLLNEFITK